MELLTTALLVLAAISAVLGLCALTVWGFVWLFKKVMGWK